MGRGERTQGSRTIRVRRGAIPLRAFAPNAVTAMALCLGLTGIRYAVTERWDAALIAILIAGVLDGLDGTIARLLRAQSRFGEQLDSLSDAIAFGVAPTFILYLWSLQHLPKFGWIAALTLALACALRLARYNATIDAEVDPKKAAGYLTGVPAPAGAGLAFLPIYAWLVTDWEVLRQPLLVAAWAIAIAILMISNVPTLSWKSLRLRRSVRLEAIFIAALLAAALFTLPFPTLTVVCIAYLITIPFSIAGYARVKRRQALAGLSAAS